MLVGSQLRGKDRGGGQQIFARSKGNLYIILHGIGGLVMITFWALLVMIIDHPSSQ